MFARGAHSAEATSRAASAKRCAKIAKKNRIYNIFGIFVWAHAGPNLSQVILSIFAGGLLELQNVIVEIAKKQ